MKEIANIGKLELNASKELCYEGKKLGKWWGVTLYYLSPENKLYVENFSLFGLLFRKLFGYKKHFNLENFSKWVRLTENNLSPSSQKVSKVALAKLINYADPSYEWKLKAYRNALYRGVSEDGLIAMIQTMKLNVNSLVREEVNETLLIEACVQRRFKLAKYLIEQGADINEKANEKYGLVSNSALHGAISERNKEMALLLLEKGADLEQGNTYGETSLLAAIDALTLTGEVRGRGSREDGIAIIEHLLEKGAKADVKIDLLHGHGTWRPLERAIFRLNEREDAFKVAKLLIENGAPVDPEGRGWEYVYTAIYKNNLPLVELLLGKDIDLAKSKDKTPTRETPLIAAVDVFKGDKEKLIRLLHSKGADIDEKGSYFLCTPLHIAVKNGDLATVKLLLELRADKTLKNRNGKTALDLAKEQGNQKIIRALEG